MRYNTRRRGRIVAEDEIMDEEIEVKDEGGVSVDPDASELLFEAEDVAELVAEITGEVVEVTADGPEVTFAVGDGEGAEEYTVSADGDEEVLEASRRAFRGKRRVAASSRVPARRPASRPARRPAARRSSTPVKASKVIRKVPSSRKFK